MTTVMNMGRRSGPLAVLCVALLLVIPVLRLPEDAGMVRFAGLLGAGLMLAGALVLLGLAVHREWIADRRMSSDGSTDG